MTSKKDLKLRNNSTYQRLYKEYLKFMDEMANEDIFIEGVSIHLDYKQWLKENNVPQSWLDLMGDDLMRES